MGTNLHWTIHYRAKLVLAPTELQSPTKIQRGACMHIVQSTSQFLPLSTHEQLHPSILGVLASHQLQVTPCPPLEAIRIWSSWVASVFPHEKLTNLRLRQSYAQAKVSDQIKYLLISSYAQTSKLSNEFEGMAMELCTNIKVFANGRDSLGRAGGFRDFAVKWCGFHPACILDFEGRSDERTHVLH